jgi:hypothetical protein
VVLNDSGFSLIRLGGWAVQALPALAAFCLCKIIPFDPNWYEVCLKNITISCNLAHQPTPLKFRRPLAGTVFVPSDFVHPEGKKQGEIGNDTLTR